MSFWKWSRTAASNATADGSINWAEGQAPSTVNDSARAMMAAASKYRDDVAGAIATAGTSSAYTLASFQVFDTLAHMDGAMIAFTPHTGNSTPVTLNVDGLGAKPLRTAPGQELAVGALVTGTPYVATYFNATGEWILRSSFAGADVPLGVALPFFASVLPGSNFVFPSGQAISRTTYGVLFALLGTTYGAGDGSTTFNIPDLRGYVLAGKDDMNGSAANRITSGGSGIAGTTLGAAGGAETVTLGTGQIPAHTHSVSGTTDVEGQAHSHNYSGTTAGQSADHTHTFASPLVGGAGTFAGGGSNFGGTAGTGGTSNDHTHGYSGTTAAENQNHTHTFSATSSSVGSGGAHQNMPPTRICNFIMRIL
jgi:microcystin-dependent protein